MGTVFQVPWTYLPEDRPWTELLHELGFRTAAMALRDDSLSIADPRLAAEERLAVVLGTEGGRTCLRDHCRLRLYRAHPDVPRVDSLNVAAASAVAFYQLGKCEK